MQVKFTDPAKFRLKEIFIYYKLTASLKVANKIKQSIFDKALSLKKFPRKGQLRKKPC
jgi:plasmid stabilization system protein ParE